MNSQPQSIPLGDALLLEQDRLFQSRRAQELQQENAILTQLLNNTSAGGLSGHGLPLLQNYPGLSGGFALGSSQGLGNAGLLSQMSLLGGGLALQMESENAKAADLRKRLINEEVQRRLLMQYGLLDTSSLAGNQVISLSGLGNGGLMVDQYRQLLAQRRLLELSSLARESQTALQLPRTTLDLPISGFAAQSSAPAVPMSVPSSQMSFEAPTVGIVSFLRQPPPSASGDTTLEGKKRRASVDHDSKQEEDAMAKRHRSSAAPADESILSMRKNLTPGEVRRRFPLPSGTTPSRSMAKTKRAFSIVPSVVIHRSPPWRASDRRLMAPSTTFEHRWDLIAEKLSKRGVKDTLTLQRMRKDFFRQYIQAMRPLSAIAARERALSKLSAESPSRQSDTKLESPVNFHAAPSPTTPQNALSMNGK
jgi:hypothetical protein